MSCPLIPIIPTAPRRVLLGLTHRRCEPNVAPGGGHPGCAGLNRRGSGADAVSPLSLKLGGGAKGLQLALPIAALQELLPGQCMRIDFPTPRQVALGRVIAIFY